MNKKIYIDGTVVIDNGIIYAADIIAKADESYKLHVDEVISPKDGMFYIKKEYGSIFNTYIIKGDIATRTIGSCRVKFYNNDTNIIFLNDIKDVLYLLDNAAIPEESSDLFLQQIYISIFGALENYLFNTFLNHVCRDFNIYLKVINECVNILEKSDKSDERKILEGKDCLKKEKLFINKIQKIVFHNQKYVNSLFESAFGIKSCISNIDNETRIRHDLVHRMGRKIGGEKIIISKELIFNLIDKVKLIAENISKHS